MARFTLPRDIYYGRGTLDVLETIKGKRAIVVVLGSSSSKERAESARRLLSDALGSLAW